MKKKILILVMAALLAVSIPVFAEESANAADPGITPDNPLYILDKLAEKIQLAIITDAVKEAEALAGLAQERLAESKAMVEAKNVAKAAEAINEYKELMDKAVDVIDAAAKDGKTVAKTIDMIAEHDAADEAVIEKLMDKVPAEYKAELEKAIESLPEKEAAKPETEKVNTASVILTGKIQDKAVLAKITEAGLNHRQIAAIVSLAEQSEKDLSEVVDLFLANSRGIGKTILELGLAPKDAMKGVNKTFKELKKEIKSDDKDEDKSSKKNKESAKLEKKVEKAAEKLEKKIEQAEKKYEKKFKKKFDKKFNKDDDDDDEDEKED